MIRLIGCSLLSACLAMSGCGGGGGGGSSNPNSPGSVNTAPVADAGRLQNVKTGAVVTLNGSASHDADGDTLTYHWKFISRPATSSATLDSPTSPKPRFIADQSGLYELELVVNDGQVNSEAATVSVTATTQNSPPVANAGTNQAVATGNKVILDGRQSTDADGDSLTYHWSFSNRPAGSLAILIDANSGQPAFTPDIDGEYRLSLIVNDGVVDSSPAEISIIASTANSRPVANAGTDQIATVGKTIILDGSLSQDADNDPLSYHWAFVSKPDTSTATLTGKNSAKPYFIADVAGDYVISLTVNDGQVDSLVDNVTVTVNSAPVASAGEDQSVNTGETVTLDGSDSHDPDHDQITYHWQFISRPEGSEALISNKSTISPTFVADLPGQYIIELTVSDGKADSASAQVTITVTRQNTTPTANAGADQAVYIGSIVTLDGSNSSDADDDGLTYHWQFVSRPEGSYATLTGPHSIAPSFEADLVGTYVIELIVSDSKAQSEPDQVIVTATKANTAPIASAGDNQTLIAGSLVNLDGSASYDADGDPITYQWRLTSKPSASQAELFNSTIITPSFTADVPGEYTISLTVNDGTDSTTSLVLITVTPKEHTLTYTAGPGGTLSGETQQVIHEGSDGRLVTAIPDIGFSFFQWSDGLTTPDRIDKDIQSDLNLSALFKTSLTKPDNLEIKSGDGQLIVSWDNVYGASGYNLYYATETGVTASNYERLQGGARVSYSSSPASLAGLVNGKTYHLVVTATLASSESEESEEVSGVPLMPVTPWKDSLHEGSINIQIDSPNQATVNWQRKGNSTYNLYISQTPTIDLDNYAVYGADLITDADSGHILTGLSAKNTYYVALEEDGTFVSWTRFKTGAWGVDGNVRTQAIGADGTRYIAGSFTTVGISIGGGEAFSTGSIAQSLGMPTVNGSISAIEPDGFGGWYIGGSFSIVDGQPRKNLAHINNQGILTNWAPSIEARLEGANASVDAIAADKTTVYVGGSFDKVNGQDRKDLAAFNAYQKIDEEKWHFNGSLRNWRPSEVALVSAIAIDSNGVYVGQRRRASRIVSYKRTGELSSWSPSTDGTVHSLIIAEDTLYVSGSFNEIDGVQRNGLAAFDSSGQLKNWSPRANGTVRRLFADNGSIYIGGAFTDVDGVERRNIASVDSYGNVTSWNPTTDGDVYAISSSSDGIIYIAGTFENVNGSARSRVAALDADGNLTDWKVRLGHTSIHTLSIREDLVYMGGGGNFLQLGLFSRKGLAAFDYEDNLTKWQPSTNGLVETISVANDTIYLGGQFSEIDDLDRHNLAAIDTEGNVTNWSPTTDNRVDVIRYHDGVIYSAGIFTAANSIERKHLAAFDGQGAVTGWSPAIDYPASAMEISSDRIYIGGTFTQVDNKDRRYLAAFDTSGELLDWSPHVNDPVRKLAIKGDIIYAGGSFTYAFPEDRKSLAAFDLSGKLTSWNPNITDPIGGSINAIAVGENAVYVSGSFGQISGNPLKDCCLASFDLNGQLTNWRPQPDQFSPANSIVLGNGKIHMGGLFSEMGGKLRSGMAQFDEGSGRLIDP